jgi:hypothetical protein
MKISARLTAQACLFTAAWIVSGGLKAEDFSLGRFVLPQHPTAPAMANAAPEAAAPSNGTGGPLAGELAPASRRQPGVFANPDDERLDRERGMADTHVELANNTNNASANVGNNTAANLTTGNNIIRDGSLSNSSGIPMLIQNSGNNVVIQSSTILNLRLQ